MRGPTLSVLLPNYNHARFLPDAVEGVLRQSRPPDEVLILDDCSTDNSMEVISGLAEAHPTIRVIQNPKNLGVNASINRLVSEARGDYVLSVAADDRTLPGLFEESMGLLGRHPEAGLCSAMLGLMSQDGEDLGLDVTSRISRVPCYLSPRDCFRALMRYEAWLNGCTCMFNRKFLLAARGFVGELGPYADMFLQKTLALRHGACFVPKPLAMWRRMPSGFSAATALDLEKSLKIAMKLDELMRGEFADAYPPALARRTLHLYVFYAAYCPLEANLGAIGRFLDAAPGTGRDGVSRPGERLWASLLGWLPALGQAVFAFLLILRLRLLGAAVRYAIRKCVRRRGVA